MSSPNLEIMTELLEAGVHYGHQTKRWNPKMRDFILEEKNSIYIIDLSITVEQLARAAAYLGQIVNGGGKILLRRDKKSRLRRQSRKRQKSRGNSSLTSAGSAGTLTNLQTIRRSVARLREFEELEKTPAFARMNKQETSALRREASKLRRNLEGIMDMDRLPDALVVIDTNREEIAVAEAVRLKIPVVAIVDTNCDPEKIEYPIAGNDDAIRSIRVILQKLVDAIVEGQGVRGKTETTSELAAVAE